MLGSLFECHSRSKTRHIDPSHGFASHFLDLVVRDQRSGRIVTVRLLLGDRHLRLSLFHLSWQLLVVVAQLLVFSDTK